MYIYPIKYSAYVSSTLGGHTLSIVQTKDQLQVDIFAHCTNDKKSSNIISKAMM